MESAVVILPHLYPLAPPRDPKATCNECKIAYSLLWRVAGYSGEGSMTQPASSSPSKSEGQQSTQSAMVIFDPSPPGLQKMAAVWLEDRPIQQSISDLAFIVFLIFIINKNLQIFKNYFYCGKVSCHSTRVEVRGQFPGVISLLSCEFCSSNSDHQA